MATDTAVTISTMIRNTLKYNKSVKGADGKTYYIPGRSTRPIPTTVAGSLPDGLVYVVKPTVAVPS